MTGLVWRRFPFVVCLGSGLLGGCADPDRILPTAPTATTLVDRALGSRDVWSPAALDAALLRMRAAIEEEEYIIATFKVRHPSDGRIALAEEQTRERRRKFERWRAGVDPAVVAGASARMGWVTFGDETPPIEGPSAPNEFMTLIHRPYSSASTGVPVTYTGIRHRHTVRVTRDGTLVRNYDSGTFGAAATRLDTTKWLLYYSSDRIYGDECGFTQALSYHTYTDIGGLTLTSNSHDSQSTCTIVAPSGSTPPDEGGGGGGGGEEWCLYYVVYTPDGRIISQEELSCWIQ